MLFDSEEAAVKAFEDGSCDAFTSDASALAGERSRFTNPDDYIILPESISKEPLGPAVRQGDPTCSISRAGPTSRCSMPKSSASPSKNVDEMLAPTIPR